MNFSPSSVSIDAYSRDIKIFFLKGYKYLRTVRQFQEMEEISPQIFTQFLKKLKATKRLNKLILQTLSDAPLGFGMVNSLLRTHSQRIHSLNISGISQIFSNKNDVAIPLMKRLHAISTFNGYNQIRRLRLINKIEFLNLDLTHQKIQLARLYLTLVRLNNLKNISLQVPPPALGDIITLLDQFLNKFDRKINIGISTGNDQNYSPLPNLSHLLTQKLTKLRLFYISEASLLNRLLSNSNTRFKNLKSLTLQVCTPDLELTSYLKHLEELESVKKLSLCFLECWSKEFSEKVIMSLRIPASLEDLKLMMSLSLKDLIAFHKGLIDEMQDKGKFPWRRFNLFEDEPLLVPFYNTIQSAKNLKKLNLKFQMLESFNSHYSNFFTSVLKRLLNLSSFAIHLSDYNNYQLNNEVSPECFDVALMLDECSKLKNLEDIEVYMPNLLFENAKISQDLKKLKSFNIGISEYEEKEIVKFHNISKYIRGFLKVLASNAPNLVSLILDFVEIVDETTFHRRFVMIEKFKSLEYFCGRFILKDCDIEIIKNIGKILNSLKRLDTVVLEFIDSHKNAAKIKRYLRHHKSIRDVVISHNKLIWIGHPSEVSISEAMINNYENDNSEYNIEMLDRFEMFDPDAI